VPLRGLFEHDPKASPPKPTGLLNPVNYDNAS
jgi:hypothetical protein